MELDGSCTPVAAMKQYHLTCSHPLEGATRCQGRSAAEGKIENWILPHGYRYYRRREPRSTFVMQRGCVPQRDYRKFDRTFGTAGRTIFWGDQGGRMTCQLTLRVLVYHQEDHGAVP